MLHTTFQRVNKPLPTRLFGNQSNHVKLWSDFSEIGDFLNVTLPQELNHENEYFQHLNFKAGQRVFALDQKFDALFFIHSGFLKSVSFDEFGNEQVLSFPMRGDILGIDSMHASHYSSEAITLTDCNIILLPYKKILDLSHNYVQIGQALLELVSKELAHQQVRLAMLGKTIAEARVAQFLVSLSERFFLLGYSKNEFNLRMTRNDIGNYLGITLETVSRVLSSMNELGIVTVHQRKIQINNIEALKTLCTVTRPHA